MSSSAKSGEKYLFVFSALVILTLCFTGFARSYYLRVWLSRRGLSPILHMHGLIMTAWVVLFLVQIIAVARHHIRLHRRLGLIGAVLAVIVVALGAFIIASDIGKQSPQATMSLFWTLFIAFDGINLILFGGFVSVALLIRHRSDVHKRLMLMATLSLLPPALGRIAIYFVPDGSEPITKLALLGLCCLIVVLVDSLWNRRLHPGFAVGMTLLLTLNYATYLAQVSA